MIATVRSTRPKVPGKALLEAHVAVRGGVPGRVPDGHSSAGTSSDAPTALAARLGGTVLAPGLIRIDTRFALPLQHGRLRLHGLSALARSHLHALGLVQCDDARSLVFFDTETNGLAGGAGSIAWMIGAARLTADDFTVTQWMLLGYQAERAMIDAFSSWLGDRATLVSYNGRSFDAPLIASRCALNRRPDPLASLCHLDLLPVARRLPARSAPDRRLSSIERHWLGVQRTNDLPGSEAPRAWRDWLARGATALLPGVLLHNRIDLLSLLAVGIYAGGYLADLLAEQAYSPAPEVHGVYGVHGAPGASAQSLAAATRHDKGVQSRSGASIAWHRLFASSAKRARDAAPALAL